MELVSSNTSVQLAAKIARYRNDPVAFFREQLTIRTKEGTMQRLNLWPCQSPIMDLVKDQREKTGWVRLAVLKARQVGASVLSEAYITHQVTMYPNTNGIVVAHDVPTAETLFGIGRTFLDYMDADIKPDKRYNTRREIVLENPDDRTRHMNPGLGSRMVITSSRNISSGIGRTLRSAHISEAARFETHEGIVDGIFPALAKKPGTSCIIESTAQYSGIWFREFCQRAERRDGDFWFVFVPWYLQPDYAIPLLPGERIRLDPDEREMTRKFGLKPEQVKFFRAELATIGNAQLFKQNYPFTAEEAWVTPGDQVFPWKKLDEQTQRHVRPPKRIADIYPNAKVMDNPGGRLLIWEEPQPGAEYDIGVDVAAGGVDDDDTTLDRDYSVFCVIRRGSLEQVAEWHSRAVEVIHIASLAASLGSYYNRAQIAVEINGIGIATNMHLSKLGYPSLYRWRYRDEASPRVTKRIGWHSTNMGKKWLVSFATHILMNDKTKIRSRELIDELRNFVHVGHDRYGGAAGYHDDRVMAYMIALTTSDDENFGEWAGLTTSRVEKALSNDPRALGLQPYEYDSTHPLLTRSTKLSDPWD